jgi:hypothetical protein
VSAIAAALTTVAWLGGIMLLLRFPIVSVGGAVALVAWTWDPGGFWLALAVTAVVSLAWREFGPTERVLPRYPELSVALAAAAVALLAGGQVAAAALAVLGLALGWFLSTTVIGLAISRADRRPLPATAARPAPKRSVSPAPVTGFLGASALRIDAGQCPSCGGLLIATGLTHHDPTRGPVFLAEARCNACGTHLVGVGDATDPGGPVTWIDPDDRWEGIA